MNVCRLVGTAVALIAATSTAYGQTQSAAQSIADGWRAIVPSHDNNFSVRCFKGKDLVWGVYPRGGTSEWNVARDIWVKSSADGRITAISLQRGFNAGDAPVTYFPANDISCEITQQ